MFSVLNSLCSSLSPTHGQASRKQKARKLKKNPRDTGRVSLGHRVGQTEVYRCPMDFQLFSIERLTKKGIFTRTPTGCSTQTLPASAWCLIPALLRWLCLKMWENRCFVVWNLALQLATSVANCQHLTLNDGKWRYPSGKRKAHELKKNRRDTGRLHLRHHAGQTGV